MSSRSYSGYLFEIVSYCQKIEIIKAELTDVHAYSDDFMRRAAIERFLSIIGEILVQSSRMFPQIHDDISNIRAIIGFRNRLAHEYLHIDDTMVWQILIEHLPVLKEEALCALEQLEP